MAIFGLAFMLDFMTEEALMGFDPRVITLVNHLFGPVVQLIVGFMISHFRSWLTPPLFSKLGIVAIISTEITILQSILIGTILMNLLLVGFLTS
jgi:hypothetical protein